MADGPLTRLIRARSVKCIEPVGAGDRSPTLEIDAGTVHINWTPLWRADPCPTAA